MNSVLGRKDDNPLPPTRTDKQLMEDFATYFLNIIDKIRDKFAGIEPYKPRQLDIQQLVKFVPVTSSQLEKTIKKMQPKICDLDIIPTSKLEILPGCLPSITHLVNSLLDQGTFSEDWKEVLVKPLIKKKSLGTQNSNYRPVSNLSFISKVIEKTTLDQFN